MSLTYEVTTSPAGKTILKFRHNEQQVLVALNTFYPLEADLYIIFLPHHKVMMEALSIMEGIEMNTPISFDHAQFLVTEFFASPNGDDYGNIETGVEAGFQEAWPHVSSKG